MYFHGIPHGKATELVAPMIHTAFNKACHKTSTVADFDQIIAFHDEYLEYSLFVRSLMGRVPLILEATIESSYDDSNSDIKHCRRWHNLLSLVSEVRIAIESLGIPLGAIANTSLLMFLGSGLFTAGKRQDLEMAKAEAMDTVDTILSLCPNVTGLWHHGHRTWSSSAGFVRDIPGVGGEIMLELHRRLHSQLTMMQVMRPFPKDIAAPFSENLQVLVLDSKLIPELHNSRYVDWTLFRAGADGALNLKRLDKLALEFDKPVKGMAYCSPCFVDVTFPAVTQVKVKGLEHSIVAMENYLHTAQCRPLTLVTEPYGLERMGLPILRCATLLAVNIKDRHTHAGQACMTRGIYRLFRHGQQYLSGARVTGMYHPMPPSIKWPWLHWLHLTPVVACANSMLNVIGMLKHLHVLVIDAYSLERKHLMVVGSSSFLNSQSKAVSDMDDAVKGLGRCVSDQIVRLDIRSCKPLCVSTVVKVVSRLPNLTSLGVSPGYVDAVAQAIGGRASGSSEAGFRVIHVREYSSHIGVFDG
ncbi:hypothetical protein DL89DRAFT_265809 [Linderina pennispora]|uniref:Uncharacterized protein n=1 Tax=Linderina pennispora TaxID=61395 RepID=A0A1Y1WG43_9FUNG|nr:uncharacterized protein DL89DRAFT_265809 [Linderina pennispora]ORX72186.1 hypothetical protein DL89DRAFT_265809 [Linderina pennispora]